MTVIDAVIDALAPFGVRDLDVPTSLERVWRESCRTDEEGRA
jgi:carbon-monoxide dehydrogenase large subunit